MTLKNIIPVYCLFIFSLSFSQIPIKQEFKLVDGEPYKKTSGEMLSNEYFCYQGKALSIKFNGRYIYYQMYDIDKLTSVKMETVEKKEIMPEEFLPEGSVQNGDFVFQFYSTREVRKGRNGHKIFMQKVRISTGSFSNPKLFFKDDYIPRRGRRIKISRFGENRFLINYKLINIAERYPDKPLAPIRDGDEREVLGFVMCDEEMNILWEKKLIMPHRIKDVNVLDLLYEEASEKLVMLVNRPNEEKHFEVWKFDEFNENREVIKLSCNNCNNFIHSVRFKQTDSGHFFLAGFIGDRSLTNGFYIGEFDSNGVNIKELINEIPIKMINDYNKYKVQKNNLEKIERGEPVGVLGLSLTDYTINENGTVVLHGEAYNGNSSINYGSIAMGGIPMASSEHFYQSIFAAKIDSSGNVLWMNKMPKNQFRDFGRSAAFNVLSTAYGDMDLSYNYLHTKNYHYFVFMDHEENFNLRVNEFPVEHASRNRGTLMTYRINDETGELNKLHLFNSRDTRGMMLEGYITKNLTSIDDNEFFIEMHKKKQEDVLLKIELED